MALLTLGGMVGTMTVPVAAKASAQAEISGFLAYSTSPITAVNVRWSVDGLNTVQAIMLSQGALQGKVDGAPSFDGQTYTFTGSGIWVHNRVSRPVSFIFRATRTTGRSGSFSFELKGADGKTLMTSRPSSGLLYVE
jgi:hypothetical protein